MRTPWPVDAEGYIGDFNRLNEGHDFLAFVRERIPLRETQIVDDRDNLVGPIANKYAERYPNLYALWRLTK